ncbi:MAG: zinc ribbon domain-containing protein [Dehalococcoidia bacterium]|nr:zinc ribbon domain-containing protein [Dehalococcoidia bacterium]
MNCPKCRAQNDAANDYCGDCGASLAAVKAEASTSRGDILRCANCKSPLQSGTKFCEDCGAPVIEPNRVYCPHCGAGNDEANVFCSKCGVRLSGSDGAHAQAGGESSGTKPEDRASAAWWVLAFVPLIGALVVLMTLRKDQPEMGTRIIVTNIGLTMILLFNLMQIFTS